MCLLNRGKALHYVVFVGAYILDGVLLVRFQVPCRLDRPILTILLDTELCFPWSFPARVSPVVRLTYGVKLNPVVDTNAPSQDQQLSADKDATVAQTAATPLSSPDLWQARQS